MKWDDRLGTIEPGKLADITAINGDPLKDMGDLSTENISFVMKDGEIYKQNGIPCRG